MKKLLNRTENKKQIFRYWIRQVCEKRKDKVVFSYLKDDQTILSIYYASLFNYIKSIEENLNHVGGKKTNRVAIIAPNSPYAVMAGTALAYAGCKAVMIDASLPVEEIRRLLEESDVTAAFVDESLREKIGWEYLKKYPIFNLNGSEPFALSDKGLNKTKGSRICDQDEEVIAIIYSSGTTARMKGICITYQSIVYSVSIYQKLTGVKHGNRYLYVLPFNHIAGYSGALQHILLGCEMDMIDNMDSTKLANAFQVFQPHYFAIVPRVYEIMEEKIRSEVRTQGKEKKTLHLDIQRYFPGKKEDTKHHIKCISSYLRDQMATAVYYLITRHIEPIKREKYGDIEQFYIKEYVADVFEKLKWQHDVFEAEYLTKKTEDDLQQEEVVKALGRVCMNETVNDSCIDRRVCRQRLVDMNRKDVAANLRNHFYNNAL